MPTTAHTRRQNHGTRGTFRDRVLDWQATSEVSASNHLVVTLSDLGIKNLRPTRKELTKAANKLLELAIAEPVPPTTYGPDDFEAFAHNYGDPQDLLGLWNPTTEDLMTGDDLPSNAYLATGDELGFPTIHQSRRDNARNRGEDIDSTPEDDLWNGGDRTMSGFSFKSLP